MKDCFCWKNGKLHSWTHFLIFFSYEINLIRTKKRVFKLSIKNCLNKPKVCWNTTWINRSLHCIFEYVLKICTENFGTDLNFVWNSRFFFGFFFVRVIYIKVLTRKYRNNFAFENNAIFYIKLSLVLKIYINKNFKRN